ncbi:DUF2505 domain-containing protein [Kocuria massiliensis]|uniref:DUF2505 domain-containing protein n=1 Tax=Kocuria massiliensis TaxID=1926282 RepID=UPI000A1CA2FC|nr:DUF2505 domain-containing protein [Kocuria massiliensis]
MAMQESHTINAPIDQVLEAFSSEDFARHVAQKAGVGFESLSVDGDRSSAFTVTTVRSVGADKVPSIAQKFVGNGVKLTQVDEFSAPQGDGSRTVETSIDVSGMPVSATAHQNLTSKGETTVVDVKGEVKANIPLVGKKISAAAEPYIGKALSLQSTTAEAWIKDHN